MAIDFWFDFASSYSYLTIQRIEQAANRAEVDINWRPFLLGPIFASQGWDTSPFNIYKSKGRFMIRDMERKCHEMKIPFCSTAPLPVRSVLSARLAIAAFHHPKYQTRAPELCKNISNALWGYGKDISKQDILVQIITDMGIDFDALSQHAESTDIKPILRENTQEAIDLGVFGAPSFTVNAELTNISVGLIERPTPELFWGDDQLEDALRWQTTPKTA